MCHFQPRSPKPALDVEPLIGLAAVQNTFVAAYLLSDEVQCLDNFQAEFLALLVFGDGNVFDVSDYAEVVNTVKYLVSPVPHSLRPIECQQKGNSTYNFLSTISAPVPTILDPSSTTSK
jgi:hypothetical protein